MARVLPYERAVDAVLTQVNPVRDAETQNEMKIKEEPNDTTLNIDTTGDHMLVKICSDTVNRDELLLSENNVSRNNVNNKKNKHMSNARFTHLDNVDKTLNLKRKASKLKKQQIHDTLSPPKKKRKYFNESSKNENTNTLCTTTEGFRRKRKPQSATLDFKTKIRHASLSKKNKCLEKCDICFRMFSSFRNREAHKQYYESVGDYKCKICQKHYTTREKLHSHNMICHHMYSTNLKFFMYCNFCGRPFKDKGFLQSHLFHAHSQLIYCGNITKCKNPRSKNINTSREVDTSKINKELVHEKYKESSCSSPCKPIQSEELNTTLINNETSSTKKLRQPTLTEYLELRKKRYDSPHDSKLDIMKDDFLTFALDHNRQMKGNLKQNLLEDDNGHVDSLPTTSINLPEHSALEQSQKYDVSPSKKPFVKVHADVEMMKSFLEKLSDTVTKDMIRNPTNDIVSYNREIPYSLRSKIMSSTETNINLRKRRNKNMSKTSQVKTRHSTIRTRKNMPDSEKVDSNFGKITVRFNCKDCIIPLTRCEEESKNVCQISTTNLKTPQCSSTLFQKSENVKNKITFKELEVSVERLATAQPTNLSEEKILDVKKHNDYFLCKICEKSFSSKSDKRIHIKSSHIAYMSSICDARYTLKHKLLQHYLQEHLFKSNQCCICYMLLPDYVTLKRHLNVHCLKYIQRGDDQYPVDIEIKCNSTKITYKCLDCRKPFSSQSALIEHQSDCTIQTKMEEDKKDSMKETNMFQGNVSEVQCNKDADEIAITHNEDIHSADSCESSNNDPVEKLNKCGTSLVAEKESQVNEDNQNSSVSNNEKNLEEIRTVNHSQDPQVNENNQTSSVRGNGKNPKEIRIIDTLQDSEKPLESDNSTISKQNIAQLDDLKSQVEIYPCDICGRQFHKRKNLEQHIRTFSYSVVVCPMCGTGFSSKRLLRTHIAAAHVPQISKTYSFHCMFCNQGFIKKYELRPHVLHLHGQQMLETFMHDSRADQGKSDKLTTHVAICNVCNLVFETRDRYVEHRMYYYKNHSFTCSLCTQSFEGMYMFHHHNKLVHYSEDKRKSYSYICDICNEGFNHESHFHSHNMHVHSNEEMLTDITKECEEESLFDEASETQEIINFSPKQRKEIVQLSSEFSCHICQLKCTNIEEMIKHRILYSNDGDYKCDKCNRQCRTRNLLEQHQKLTHICRDVYNGHVCHICGEILETITSLECHKKHFHPNYVVINPNNCKNCGQRLSSHITGKAIKHKCESNDKIVKYSYDCLFCDMKFSNAGVVQMHIAQAHTDDLLAKQAVLKSALPTIDKNNIQKQIVQQLMDTDQASLTSSSENTSTQSFQQSDNISSKNGIKDRTAIKSSNRSESTLPKNDKITEKSPIPANPLDTSKVNVSTSMNATSSNEFKSNTSVPLSSGSTDDFRNKCEISSPPESIAKLKANSVSLSNKSTDKPGMFINKSTGRKSVNIKSPRSWKNICLNFKSVNNYDYSPDYICPLCPLAYPSLMFFHAHLKYAHADSIRTNMTLQSNETTQKVSTSKIEMKKIECLLCPRIFSTEIKYKKHLRSTHTRGVCVINSEDVTKMNNAKNPPIVNNKGNATPEVITVDDDNIKNTSDQRTKEVATALDHSTQSNKIGKLRVKSFAKIIENLSTDHTSQLLHSK